MTEPQPPTLSEVVRRAVEIVDPEGISGDVERFFLHFEDRDEPISAIEDIQAEAFDAATKMGAEDPADPSVTMAAAVTTYLGFRRDEVTKRRPDGSTYSATRSVRVSRKSGKEI